MGRRAATRITADVGEEFTKLRKELSYYLDPDKDVDQARRLLVDHAPEMVVAKAQLLLDTLLNYLMEDATKELDDAPTTVKNAFYDLDLRSRIKESFSLKPKSLEFPLDPRLIAGGVAAGATATAGGLVTALFLCGLLSRIIGGVATLVASAIAFRVAHAATTDTARKRFRDDVDGYLTRSEQQVSDWLAAIKEDFLTNFEKFQNSERRPNGGTV